MKTPKGRANTAGYFFPIQSLLYAHSSQYSFISYKLKLIAALHDEFELTEFLKGPRDMDMKRINFINEFLMQQRQLAIRRR